MLEIRPKLGGLPSTTSPFFRSGPRPAQLPHHMHSETQGRPGCCVENAKSSAIHPPNCSVSLLINLFKSLSFLRTPSILSTQCNTVMACLPPHCRPLSGSDASGKLLAR